MKRYVFTMVIGCAVLASQLSRAQPRPGLRNPGGREGRPGANWNGRRLRGNADANDDGVVDDIEAKQAAESRIEIVKSQLAKIRRRFDENGDGTLDEEEIKKLRNAMESRGGGAGPMRILGMLDTDRDWQISADEEAAAREKLAAFVKEGKPPRPEGQGHGPGMGERFFQNPDTDGNCLIDETEALIVAEKNLEQMRRWMSALKRRAENNPRAPVPPVIAQIDPNRDWEIDEAEAEAFLTRKVDELQERNKRVLKVFDDNGDGALQDAELEAAKKAFEFISAERQAAAGRMGARGKGRPDGENRGFGGQGGGRRGPPNR